MAGNETTASGATTADKAQTEISYCPHLGLYQYKRADGVEFMFTRQKLEDAVAMYLKEGDTKQAEFLAILTTYARKYPHVIVTVLPNGHYYLTRLEIPADEKNTKLIDDCLTPVDKG